MIFSETCLTASAATAESSASAEFLDDLVKAWFVPTLSNMELHTYSLTTHGSGYDDR